MHVLIVDDKPDIRLLLEVALTASGYHVECTMSGLEALARLRSSAERPCVILLDVAMPGMSGWQLLAELQTDAALAAIPVVILSALAQLPTPALESGVAAVLRKPIDLAALRALVAQYCAAG